MPADCATPELAAPSGRSAAALGPSPISPPRHPGGPQWANGWVRLVFPCVFLVYLLQTAGGVGDHASGTGAAIGYALLPLFGAAYVGALLAAWDDRTGHFWFWFAVMGALFVAELPLAHQSAMVMTLYLVVLLVAELRYRALVVIGGLIVAVLVAPAFIPGWGGDLDAQDAISLVTVTIAMLGFFAVIQMNHDLTEARAEVARLAAEAERNRIARDLHDLLGHSLTTITVKAGLAHRLALRDPDRAGEEMGAVEQIARRSLTEVRAAVAGYREVTLAHELASSRELLRSAGVVAQLPPTDEAVAPEHRELFGWVLREAITNVVRHAGAERCTVTLGPAWIEIRDDGPVPAGSDRTTGLGSGLDGLRERVALAGGTLAAGPEGTDGRRGWRVRVDLAAAPSPLPSPEPVATAVSGDGVPGGRASR